MYNTFASPWLFSGRNQSRFQFAHSVDPVKKDEGSDDGLFKFGFGLYNSDVDKDEIQVPIKVQAYIQRSLRTLSNSISNRSPEVVKNIRSSSNSLKPVDEELIDELEQQWYTLEERAQEQMQPSAQEGGAQPNPFRHFKQKEKDQSYYQQVATSLKVERVKYKINNMSPGDDANRISEEYEKAQVTTHFQVTQNKESLRPKAVRRTGAGTQAERIRQPPNHR